MDLKQQRWRKHWPVGFIALLAVIQLLFTFSIVGIETTSLIFDAYHSMIFAGFYCSLFFMITWISMFTVTCCNRHSLCCATHVLVENILSIIAASVLLYFDKLFLNNPYTCLYGSATDCSILNYSYSPSGYGVYTSAGYTTKMICIKAQLACASVMIVTNVIYIIIFIIVAIKSSNAGNPNAVEGYGTMPSVPYAQPIVYGHQQPIPNYIPTISKQQQQQNVQQHVVECRTCHTLLQIN